MFKVIKHVKNGRGIGHNVSKKTDTVLVTINKAGAKKEQVSIRIGIDVMRERRWVIGDRVSTTLGEYDGRPALRIQRTHKDEGHTLSASKQTPGTITTGCYKFTDHVVQKFLRRYAGTCVKPIVIDDGALIVLLQEAE